MDFLGYHAGDRILSEISGEVAVEIHHIVCKGMGGSKTKDNIENLMAVTREEHDKYGDRKQFMEYLKKIHFKFMKEYGRLKQTD